MELNINNIDDYLRKAGTALLWEEYFLVSYHKFPLDNTFPILARTKWFTGFPNKT